MTQPADYDFDDSPEEQEQEPIETNETEDQPDTEQDVEEDSESSTDSEETHNKPIFTEKQQRIFDEAIGKKTFKLREMEREAEQIEDSLVQYILEDDHGPLITKYLSQNIGLLDNLRNMHPTRAAVMIATEIKSKAAALKPKFTNAPDPIRRP
jgi:hypothetical protein